MIIGICGTHGTGKSTILNAAKDAGYPVNEAQLSRTAQKMLGWDKLSRAQESIDNMWALQDAVLQAMFDRDDAIIKSGKITVVERTPADAWAYAAMWCSRHGIDVQGQYIQDKRAAVYKGMCRDMAQRYLRFVLVPPAPEIPFVEDPHRADVESRAFVEAQINSFLFGGGLPTDTIKATSRVGRSSEIQCLISIYEAQLQSKRTTT